MLFKSFHNVVISFKISIFALVNTTIVLVATSDVPL